MTSKLQLTLAILKPDITRVPCNLATVRSMILERNFLVVRSRFVDLRRRDVERFYAEHEGKFFYNRLVTYMSSGTCHAHVLARPNAIAEWRLLMGPTKVIKTRYEHPDTIRGMFGLTDTRNTCHGSDSNESALKETSFFFPEFDAKDFYKNEAPEFIRRSDESSLEFDESAFVHVL